MKSKNEWVNFKEIEEKIGMKDILEHYGLLKELKREKNKLIGYFFCSEDHHREKSFLVDLTENTWHCFFCEESGNVLDFVSLMEDVDIKLAALLLKKWFGIISEEDRKLFKKRS